MHTLQQFLFSLLRYPFYLGASIKAFDEATMTIMPAPTTWQMKSNGGSTAITLQRKRAT
jgi:hypothetical protein